MAKFFKSLKEIPPRSIIWIYDAQWRVTQLCLYLGGDNCEDGCNLGRDIGYYKTFHWGTDLNCLSRNSKAIWECELENLIIEKAEIDTIVNYKIPYTKTIKFLKQNIYEEKVSN